jgi:hypothetical protein
MKLRNFLFSALKRMADESRQKHLSMARSALPVNNWRISTSGVPYLFHKIFPLRNPQAEQTHLNIIA